MKIATGILNSLTVLLLLLFILGADTASQAQQKPESKGTTEKKVAEDTDKTAEKTDDREKNADYWYDKGILVSVYGNDQAAIQYFQKAIELDPQRSDAYFQLGVSYGELGQYQTAVSFIGKAIEINSEKSVYYYGRGRVYLLSGDRDRALEDFKQAAAMGNWDAEKYLEKHGGRD